MAAKLKAFGIPTAVYYPKCLHEQPVFAHFGYRLCDFPASEQALREVLSLPMHPFLSRRHFLSQTATGLSSIALTHMLGLDRALADSSKSPIRPEINPANPNAARKSHFEPRAKNVLMIFCSGAVSQVDTFDYKPELIKHHGKPMPGAEGLITFQV